MTSYYFLLKKALLGLNQTDYSLKHLIFLASSLSHHGAISAIDWIVSLLLDTYTTWATRKKDKCFKLK